MSESEYRTHLLVLMGRIATALEHIQMLQTSPKSPVRKAEPKEEK